MPDRDQELAHLELADRHIASLEQSIAALLEETAASRSLGHDTVAAAEQLLKTSRSTLKEFHTHRAIVVQTIADIDAGVLPNTGV